MASVLAHPRLKSSGLKNKTLLRMLNCTGSHVLELTLPGDTCLYRSILWVET